MLPSVHQTQQRPVVVVGSSRTTMTSQKKQRCSSSNVLHLLSASSEATTAGMEQHEQQQQKQKLKTNRYVELAMLHNNIGVKCYNQHNYIEAQHHFHQMNELLIESADRLLILLSSLQSDDEPITVSSLRKHYTQEELLPKQDQLALFIKNTTRTSSARSVMDQTPFDEEMTQQQDVVQGCNNSTTTTVTTDQLLRAIENVTSSTVSSKDNKEFQRSEYDEGMHILKGVISLSEHDLLFFQQPQQQQQQQQQTITTTIDYSSVISKMQHTLLFCIVSYNQGQVCHAKDDGDGALRYFRSALKQYDLFCEQLIQQQQKQYDSYGLSKSLLLPISRTMILGNIGFIYYQQSQMLESLTVYNEALKYIKDETDTESGNEWELALILNCIGVLHFHMTGIDTESSMKFYEASLEIQQNLLTNLDVETTLSVLRVSSSVSSSSTKMNVQQQQQQQQQQLRMAEQEANNIINIGIATTLNNIGRVYYMKGDYTCALRIYQESLDMRRRYLSKTLLSRQLDIAATIYNTGQTLHQLGQLDEALTYYEEYLTIATNYFGTKHHKDIAIMLRCIAQIYHERNVYDKAERFYLEAIESIKLSKDFGPNHPEIASTLNKLGNMYYEQGDIDTALEAYEEGLVVEKKSLEENHPNISVTLSNIAQIYKLRGEYKKAIHYYKQSLKLQRKRLSSSSAGNAHPELALPISSIATIYYQIEEYDKALDLFQEALCIRTDVYGDEHLDVSATLNSIGMVLFKKGLHDLAMEAFKKSYDIRRKILGEYHRDVAIILHNMATIYLQRGDDDMAMTYYKRTLDIERKVLGHDHIDVSLTLHHIGQMYQNKGNIDQALMYLNESLNIEQLRLGYNSLSVARSYNNLANIYLQTNHTTKAMECFTKSLRIYRTLDNGENNNDERLIIVGLNLYTLGLIHPNAAPAA